MAVTLSRYLKLKIDSNLTANARYNLERLDALGAVFLPDSTGASTIRAQSDIILEPNSADVGGPGSGGSVYLGTASNPLDSLYIFSSSVLSSSGLGLLDTASGGTKYLHLLYKSNLSGAEDTTADRSLRIDLDGSDRNLILAGNLSLLGNKTLSLTATADLSLTFPATTGLAGQVLTTDGTGVLSWTSAAGSGTVTSVSLTAPSDFSVSGSPITTTGTLGLAWVPRAANLVLAGPATGSSATPNFRSLVAADMQAAGYRRQSYSWITSDGTSKTVTHSWGTRKIRVEVLDNPNDYATLEIPDVTRPTDNTVLLVSSSAPAAAWTILITEVP